MCVCGKMSLSYTYIPYYYYYIYMNVFEINIIKIF